MEQYGYSLNICSDMLTASFSSESGESLVNNMLPVIDMDMFAKKAYRKIVLPLSVSEDDSINTADAFLIIYNEGKQNGMFFF